MPEPAPVPRRIPTLSELHAGEYGCACRGDLVLCERLTLQGELRSITRRLAHNESTHVFLRDELARATERVGRSARHILDLRARQADLIWQAEELRDCTG